MLTNPVSRLNVVRVSILRKPSGFSLFGREETLLVFCNLVEPLGGFFASLAITQYYNLFEVLCRAFSIKISGFR